MNIYSLATSEVQEDSVLIEAEVLTDRENACNCALAFMKRCIIDFYELDPFDHGGLEEKLKRMSVEDETNPYNGLVCRRYIYDTDNLILSATVQECHVETRTKGKSK